MIQSIVIESQTLASNQSVVVFDKDDVRSRSANCCNGWLQHREGSPLYKLLKGGYYDVKLNANITSASTGQVALGLYIDGVLDPSSISIATINTANAFQNVSFDKKIFVCCKANTTLTVGAVPVVGAGVATQIPTVNNANFSITKM